MAADGLFWRPYTTANIIEAKAKKTLMILFLQS